MSTRFQSKKNKKKYQPAMLIAADSDDNEDDNDTTSLTSNKHNKKRSKKYKMIEHYDHDNNDHDSNDDINDNDNENELNDNNNENENENIINHSIIDDDPPSMDHTTQSVSNIDVVIGENINIENDRETNEMNDSNSDSSNQLEDVQLNYSPQQTKDKNKTNSHKHYTTNSHHRHTQLTQRDNSNYSIEHHDSNLSAYYGERLDFVTKQPKWHDKVWAIVWIIHLCAFLLIFCVIWASPHIVYSHAIRGIGVALIAIFFTFIYCLFWTFLVRYCGGFTIWLLMVGNLILLSFFAIFCFGIGSSSFIILGVFVSIFFVICMFYTLLIHSKITYTIALLQLAISMILCIERVIYVSFSILLIRFTFTFLWCSMVIAYLAQSHNKDGDLHDNSGILMILICSYLWIDATLTNIGHTTICAMTADWYFNHHRNFANNNNNPNSPKTANNKLRRLNVCDVVSRCMSTSLGSIAFGSLFVRILQCIRSVLRAFSNAEWCCKCVHCSIDFCLNGCELMLEYFNNYAFAHIAIYGSSFMKSGENTYNLLTISQIYNLVNANYIEYALFCGSICGSILTCILSIWVSMELFEFELDWVVLFAFGGLLIGCSLSAGIINACSSCIISFFVCYAEEPSLMQKHPEQALWFDGARKGIA